MSALRRAAAWSVVGLALSTGVSAQDRTDHPRGTVRFGAATITPSIHLTSIGIDTNVFNLSGTERRPGDFTATVEPQVEALVKTTRLMLRVTSLADFVYYRKYASERSINPRTNVTIERRLSSHLSLYGQGDVGFSKTRTGLEIDARARQLGGSGMGGVRLRGRKLEVDLSGGYSQTRFASNARFMDVRLADTLDRTSKGLSAIVRYRATPYTAFTIGGEQTATRFRFSSVRDIDSTRVSAGVQFSPRAMVSGDAGFGYTVARPRDPVMPRFSGFTPRVGLSYRLLDTTTFAASAQRDLEFSFQPERPYYVYVTYEGSVRQAVAHVFDVGGAVQYSILSYRSFTGPDAIRTDAGDDRLRSVMGLLGFPVTKRVRVELYGGTWKRLSADRPYRTVRSGVQVTVGKVILGERGIFVNGLGR